MDMSKEEKAAVLLLSLDEDVAAGVMRNLAPDEIKRVGKCMTSLSGTANEDVGSVAREFCSLAEGKENRIVSVRGNVVESIMVKALGDNKGRELVKSIEEEAILSDNPLIEKLKNADPKVVMAFIKMEHPQTIALILAHLEPQQMADVLENMPPDKQEDIIRRVATIGSVSHEFMMEMVKTLGLEVTDEDDDQKQVGGVKMVAEVLNRMRRSSEDAILESFNKTEPDLATEIKNLMFTFDDIFKLDDGSMRILFSEVNREDLARALKIADDEMKEKVFKNMSKRGGDMLLEDIS
nr:flagellar motor switch protein FliG [Spirochaetales bacterium]